MKRQNARFNEDSEELGGLPSDGYVKRAGDTMLGQLKGIAPVAAEDLTRKDYVDNNFVQKVTPRLTDCNLAMDVGFYGCGDPSNTTNQPVGQGWGTVIVSSEGGSTATRGQIYVSYNNTGIYYRGWQNTAGWTAWEEIGGGAIIFASAVFKPDGVIEKSYNVSGITDHGEGRWTVNFANISTTAFTSNTATPQHGDERFGNISDIFTSGIQISCWNAADNSSLRDPTRMDFISVLN